MPTTREHDAIRRAAASSPSQRGTLTRRMARLRGGAPCAAATQTVPFYPFAHLPLLRTDSYGQRCLRRLNYPSRN